MLSDTFAAVLKSGRSGFNAQYAQARRQFPALDAESFSDFLTSSVDPLIRSIHEHRPECVAEVAAQAYETGLILAGHRLVGSGARYPEIANGWRRLGAAAAALIAAEPRRMLAAMSN